MEIFIKMSNELSLSTTTTITENHHCYHSHDNHCCFTTTTTTTTTAAPLPQQPPPLHHCHHHDCSTTTTTTTTTAASLPPQLPPPPLLHYHDNHHYHNNHHHHHCFTTTTTIITTITTTTTTASLPRQLPPPPLLYYHDNHHHYDSCSRGCSLDGVGVRRVEGSRKEEGCPRYPLLLRHPNVRLHHLQHSSFHALFFQNFIFSFSSSFSFLFFFNLHFFSPFPFNPKIPTLSPYATPQINQTSFFPASIFFTSNVSNFTTDSDKEAWDKGKIGAEGQNLARTLMETPANEMTPTKFAHHVTTKLGSLPNVIVTPR